MGSNSPTQDPLPSSAAPTLHLTHPTARERTAIWTLNSRHWRGPLELDSYLEREEHLLTTPLARDSGITHWILTDSSSAPDSRPILATCESLRKRALVRTADGAVKEVVTHGIGSVFCDPKYRGRGYAGRMLQEVGEKLKTWQTGEGRECLFSILYSDIGKKFYAGHGWAPFPSTHIAFPPSTSSLETANTAKPLEDADLPQLCALDEQSIRSDIANAKDDLIHVALIPDHDTMVWHHMREKFMSQKLLGRSPSIKGAIAGTPGSRVWVVWTRTYSGTQDKPDSENTLHILRLVIEDDSAAETISNAEKFKAVLEAAQREAKEWKSAHVELWNPTPYVKCLVQRTGLDHTEVEREHESIASLMWYGLGTGGAENIKWVGNEKYGWC
jgi:GNAT superfamily N-acetyltransferase